ncbi:cobalamin-dependent protein [Desulfobacterales bacterium HSG2]|nr:cobalamin-dependent protein [Desulfobacterales bacterium HSG2]
MRWVFIRPRNYSPYYDPEIQEPLGLEYLAAHKQSQGDKVLILDSTLGFLSDQKLARRAVSFQPDAIGFSLTTALETEFVAPIHSECIRALKGRKVHWLAGGNFISTEPETALRQLPSDFQIVCYEGENGLDEMRKLWEKESLKKNDQNSLTNADRLYKSKPVENLDTLPFPIRPFADQILANNWAFNLQGSRGCCGKCRYCSSPGMSGVSANKWRGRSVVNIADEISFLNRKYAARAFNFVDEDFLGTKSLALQRARGFANEIRKRRLQISFGIQVRPDTLNEEAVNLLTKVGLIYVFMGIESDETEDYKRWNRPWTSDPWQYVEMIRRGGAEINVGVLMFHTHSTFQGIRRFANKLREHRLLEYRSAINRMDAMPGSVFYKKAMRSGQLDPEISGPQSLPFIYPGIQEFYNDLLDALSPLGPPSMHALCSLPPLLTQCRFEEQSRSEHRELMRIICLLDDAVARTFFAVLDFHEKGLGNKNHVAEMRQRNLRIAIKGVRYLAENGFVNSFDELRQAITLDSGL